MGFPDSQFIRSIWAKQMTNVFFRLWTMWPRSLHGATDFWSVYPVWGETLLRLTKTLRAFLHCSAWPVQGQPSVVRHSGTELPFFLWHFSLQRSFSPIFITNDYASSRKPDHMLSTLWSDSSVSHHLPSHIFSFAWMSIIFLVMSYINLF